jgi:hypothetical protein
MLKNKCFKHRRSKMKKCELLNPPGKKFSLVIRKEKWPDRTTMSYYKLTDFLFACRFHLVA